MQTEIRERYGRDGIHATVIGKYRTCRVYPQHNGYCRQTQNTSIHGRRYAWYATYEQAVAAALAWANRKKSN